MAKVYDYIIVLRQKSFFMIDNISRLMLLLSLAAFYYCFFSTLFFKNTQLINSQAWLLFSICAAILGWWGFCFRLQQKGVALVYYRFALMAAAFGWFIVPGGLFIAAINIVACFLEKPMKVAPEVAFDAEEIVMNTFPKKKFVWAEVNNVVFKDGMLTIDLKNNTLIQKMVDAEVTDELEKEFNSFCKEQLYK